MVEEVVNLLDTKEDKVITIKETTIQDRRIVKVEEIIEMEMETGTKLINTLRVSIMLSRTQELAEDLISTTGLKTMILMGQNRIIKAKQILKITAL